MPRAELTVGLGVAADAVITLSGQHPSAHGALRIALEVDGEVVVRAEPEVGFMHRGAEKLFEARDYRQIVMLTDRHDWLSSFASELGVVLAVERLMGVRPPDRATWGRTLLAELTRVTQHLAFLGGFGLVVGDPASAAAALGARDHLLDVVEAATGSRMHVMANQVGGLRVRLSPPWLRRLRGSLANPRRVLDDLIAPLLASDPVRRLTAGAGPLDRSVATAYGVSGPVARASGLDLDLRRDDPYLGYRELPVRVVTGTQGDALARLGCLLEETTIALDLVEAAVERLDDLPPGPSAVRVPKQVRPPEGETYCWTENPAGINGYYLVSTGGSTPWRLKLRTASFNNVQALRELLPGTAVAALPAVLGSLFFVVGDVDR